ncbi:MAG TPA: hypothetical protein VFF00_09470 [Candidatus Elarobacter sp.]|nr:hypothetical protein [Candidatus Elarobacter sp.]
MLRFTKDGRHVPSAVACTGAEGTGIPGDQVSVWCASCGKPVVLPASMSLGRVVDLLDGGKRFKHAVCVTGSGRANA